MLPLALVVALIPERGFPTGLVPNGSFGSRLMLLLSFIPSGSTIVGSLKGPRLETTLSDALVLQYLLGLFDLGKLAHSLLGSQPIAKGWSPTHKEAKTTHPRY